MRVPALHLAALLLFATLLFVGIGPVSADNSIDNVTVYSADVEGFDSTSEIESAIENGTLEVREAFLRESTLVVAIESHELAAEVQRGNGTTTERFFEAMADGRFLIGQTDNYMERDPIVIRLGPANATAYAGTERVYVGLDESEFQYVRDLEDRHPVDTPRTSAEFVVDVRYNGTAEAAFSQLFRLIDEQAAFSDSQRFDALPSAVFSRTVEISQSTNERVEVVLNLDDGTTYYRTIDANEADSSGTIYLDLRNVSEGTPYTIRLRYDGDVIDERRGRVVDEVAVAKNVTVSHQSDALELTFDATLSHGGRIEVLNDRGRLVSPDWAEGTTNLHPGRTRRVRLVFESPGAAALTVVTVRDVSSVCCRYDNAGGSFTVFPENGSVDFSTAIPTTRAGTSTAAATSTRDSSGNLTDGSRSGTPGGDGAGPIGVVLTVLLVGGIGLRAWRHR